MLPRPVVRQPPSTSIGAYEEFVLPDERDTKIFEPQ